MKTFKSILEFQKHFDTDEKCRQHLEERRWRGTPCCPFCASTNIHRFPNNKTFKCRDCRKKFSVTVGTIYENTKIPLNKWYLATYILSVHSKGISSLQLANWLNVTVKTAWFLNHRIREMLTEKRPETLANMVEADETFVGGKFRNKHQSEFAKHKKSLSEKEIWQLENKTPVLGMVERGGKVITKVVDKVTGKELQLFIRWNVVKGSTVFTDEHRGYVKLGKHYNHAAVKHSTGEYYREGVHTNTIEGFWSLLKRQIVGIHHSVSPQHLQRYCNEASYRYNNKALTQDERFELTISRCEGRLKYDDLIGK